MSRRSGVRSKIQPKVHAKTVAPPGAGRPAGLWQAGNSAVARVIGQMEQSLGEDLSGVKVHSDSKAADAAGALGALAFTRGEQIFLGAAAPVPGSKAGRKLLAHELTHVVQQRKAASVDPAAVSQVGDTFERSADRTASLAMHGQPAQIGSGGSVPGVQCELPQLVPDIRSTVSPDANRTEAEQMLKSFLEKGPKDRYGNVDIQKVRSSILQLAKGAKPNLQGKTQAALTAVLDNMLVQKKPAALAKSLAAALPPTIDRGALVGLHAAPVSEKESLGEKATATVAKGTNKTPAQGTPDAAQEQGPNDRSPYGQYVAGKANNAPTNLPPAPVSDAAQALDEKLHGKPKLRPYPSMDDEKKDTAKPAQKEAAKPPAAAAKPDVISGADPAATPAPAPAGAPAEKSQDPGLGVMPPEIASAIQEAQGREKTTADVRLAESMRGQLETVAGQVEFMMRRLARSNVTSVNIYIGGKLAKTVRLGAKK